MSLTITKHAVKRFNQRTSQPAKNPKKTVKKLAASSQPVIPPRGIKLAGLFNHNFEEAEYRFSSGWIFVVVKDVVRTVYKNNGQGFMWPNGKKIGR